MNPIEFDVLIPTDPDNRRQADAVIMLLADALAYNLDLGFVATVDETRGDQPLATRDYSNVQSKHSVVLKIRKV